MYRCVPTGRFRPLQVQPAKSSFPTISGITNMITSDKPAFLLTHRVGFFCSIERNTPSNCITAPSLRLSALLTMSIYPHFSITLPTAFEAYSSSWVSCLDGASELHRATLLLRQPGHCHRHRSLTNCLRYFTNQCILFDMDEAIELHRVVPALCSLFIWKFFSTQVFGQPCHEHVN